MADAYQQQTVNGQPTEPSGSDPLAELRSQLDQSRTAAANERAARQRAETERDGFRAQAATAQTHAVSAQEQAVDNAIASAQNELTGYEAALASAYADGKFTEAAQLQSKIGQASARLQTAQSNKEWLAGQRAQAAANPAPTAPQNTDPMANYAPAARAWISRNPAFLSDPAFHNRTLSAHHAAISEGLSENSDQYFRYIDAKLSGSNVVQSEDPVQPQRSNNASMAAPTSRSVPTGSGQRQGRPADLTPDQREVADELYGDMTVSDLQKFGDAMGAKVTNAYEAYQASRAYVSGQHQKRNRSARN